MKIARSAPAPVEQLLHFQCLLTGALQLFSPSFFFVWACMFFVTYCCRCSCSLCCLHPRRAVLRRPRRLWRWFADQLFSSAVVSAAVFCFFCARFIFPVFSISLPPSLPPIHSSSLHPSTPSCVPSFLPYMYLSFLHVDNPVLTIYIFS